MSDFDWCAEADRKAALWDAVGEPALALLRLLDAEAWNVLSYEHRAATRALLARADNETVRSEGR